MPVSGNGYEAHNTTAYFVRGTAAGFSFWAYDHDVRVIFVDLITRFNDEVEKLAGSPLDDWSWANRNVRDSDTVISNHASATAIDLNALKHPRGPRGTFSAAQVKALRKILASYDGVIRWGGDYQNTADEMHFEINASKARVRAVADRLRDDDMANLTAENLEQIAKAVLNLDVIPNKNAPKGSKNPNWSLKSMVADIENTQDDHTEILKEILAELKKAA